MVVPRPVYLTTYMMDEQTRPKRVVWKKPPLPSESVRNSTDFPDEICDLRNKQMLMSDPDRFPNSPTILLLFARLVPWRVTSKKPAKVEMAPIADGALKSANVSGAPSTFSYSATIPAQMPIIPTTHGPAPNRRSMLIPAIQLFVGLLRRFRRNAAERVATSCVVGMVVYMVRSPVSVNTLKRRGFSSYAILRSASGYLVEGVHAHRVQHVRRARHPMVRGTDFLVEKIGSVVDTATASGASSNELYEGVMLQGMRLMGRAWHQSLGSSQLGTSCPQRNERAVEICSLLEDITRRYSKFSKRRSTLRAAMEGVFESHVRGALLFELGQDGSEFLDRLTDRCAQFAGDEVVRNVVELLVELESLDVLPRLSHPVSEEEDSDDAGDSGSQLSDLSDGGSDVDSEHEDEGGGDEECDEGESDDESDSSDEHWEGGGGSGEESESDARTHAPQARYEESRLPVRKRARASKGAEESEDDADEAMRLSRACKRAR